MAAAGHAPCCARSSARGAWSTAPPAPRTKSARVLAPLQTAAHGTLRDSVVRRGAGRGKIRDRGGQFRSLERRPRGPAPAGESSGPVVCRTRRSKQGELSLLRLCAWQLAGEFRPPAGGRAPAPCTPRREDPARRREGAVDLPVGPCGGAACTYLDAADGGRYRTFWVHSGSFVDLNPRARMPRDADPRAWASSSRTAPACAACACPPSPVRRREPAARFLRGGAPGRQPETRARRRDERRVLRLGEVAPTTCRKTRSCKRPVPPDADRVRRSPRGLSARARAAHVLWRRKSSTPFRQIVFI